MARKFQYTPPGRDVVAAFERARLGALSNPFTYESELVDTGEGWDFRQNPHFAPSHARKVMLTARMLNNQGIDMSRALRLAHMKHNPRASKKGRVLHKREGGRTAPLTGLIRMPTVAEETWYTEFEDLIPSLDEQYRSGVQPEHMPRDYAGRKLPAIYENRGRKGQPKSNPGTQRLSRGRNAGTIMITATTAKGKSVQRTLFQILGMPLMYTRETVEEARRLYRAAGGRA